MDELTRRERLEASRDVLAAHLLACEAKEAPALSREYRAVLEELENLPAEKARTGFDDLAARRSSRKSNAAS